MTPDAASASKGALVLAVGSPFRRDDGLGPEALKVLKQQPLPPGITLLDAGTPGLETALLLQGWSRVIIIDAAEMHQPPGEWRRFTAAEVIEGGEPAITCVHEAGLQAALALGDALGIVPVNTVIYGMQPESIGWGSGLSRRVAEALPSLCAGILTELSTDP